MGVSQRSGWVRILLYSGLGTGLFLVGLSIQGSLVSFFLILGGVGLLIGASVIVIVTVFGWSDNLGVYSGEPEKDPQWNDMRNQEWGILTVKPYTQNKLEGLKKR